MARKVTMDAMIKRADFAQEDEQQSVDLHDKLSIEGLSPTGSIGALLRKPDFQRETNHWSPEQVAELIHSFATGQLIPSLILWKSDSYVFVIDGAHRLSALRCWVRDDFGEGGLSNEFYNGEVPNVQKKHAKATRNLVEKRVGRYAEFRQLLIDGNKTDLEKWKTASLISTRSVHVQWIQGSAEVAETSFFKINSQGSALDKVEELILKNRRSPYAISARSILRAGTGHKYWSEFNSEVRAKIESLAEELNESVFKPEFDAPVKSLNLPISGNSSSADSLRTLMEMLAAIDGFDSIENAVEKSPIDENGSLTIEKLSSLQKVVRRLVGNGAQSLGLHPIVYFYNDQGKHLRHGLLALLSIFSEKIRNNDKNWFKKFTKNREHIETALTEKKQLINLGISNIASKKRVASFSGLIEKLVDFDFLGGSKNIAESELLLALGLTGQAGSLETLEKLSAFSNDTKTAVFIKEGMKSALICPLCGGFLDPQKSISYDHIKPVSNGGVGELQNAQMTHPYCNSLKGSSEK